MATRCEYCAYEFTNWLGRRNCPHCNRPLKRPAEDYTLGRSQASARDDGFDSSGFAIGMITGVPISPSHGISTGSLIGAALHTDPARSEPVPDPSPSCSVPDSSPSYDSGSSSSGSCDSGGSSFGGSSE